MAAGNVKFLFVVLFLCFLEFLLSIYLISISEASPSNLIFSPFSSAMFDQNLLKPQQVRSSMPTNVDEPEGKRCIVYDRPPRTGSTTISKTLGRCLKVLGYKQPKWMGSESRAGDVFNMLDQPFANVGLVSRHFFMNASSLQHLYNGCDSLFYISSTAPMKERVWSVMKYRQLGRHGNGSLSESQLKQAFADLKEQRTHVQLLNSYPFWKDLSTALNTNEIERPNPDYVIRKSQLTRDLSDLLQALRCDADVKSYNIHHADVGDLLKDFEIEDDDGLHLRMTHRAETHNHSGLKKVLEFLTR